MPINELIASQVASAIGVPMPEIALVHIDEIFLEANPQLNSFYDRPVSAGYQFGSKFISPAYPAPHSCLIALAENIEDFSKIIVFDIATNNADRCEFNYDNVLLIPDERLQNAFRLLSIDHGHCFGGEWDNTLHRTAGKWCGSVMPEMALHPNVDELFREALSAAKVITWDRAASLTCAVPAEWGLSPTESDSITAFIHNQTAQLLPILVFNRHRFQRWGQFPS